MIQKSKNNKKETIIWKNWEKCQSPKKDYKYDYLYFPDFVGGSCFISFLLDGFDFGEKL